jgi:hypothetical protein
LPNGCREVAERLRASGLGLPLGMNAKCSDRTGPLVVGGYCIHPEALPAANVALRRLGVIVAIRAGKLDRAGAAKAGLILLSQNC